MDSRISLGNDVGDAALRSVATCISATVRSIDVSGRYGGEEFAIIALGANATNAAELAERLREQVRSAPMPPGILAPTLTVGVASTLDMEASADLPGLIACADRVLYRGKEAGRDRVEVYTPQTVVTSGVRSADRNMIAFLIRF